MKASESAEIAAKAFYADRIEFTCPSDWGQEYDRVGIHLIEAITQAEARGREQGLKEAAAVASAEIVETFEDSPEVDTVCNSVVREIAANITALIPGEPA